MPTTISLGGNAVGLLAESHLGRPTKVEGNPDHPASLGATDIFHQAAVLSLYDPERSKTVLHRGQTTTWEEAARRSAWRCKRNASGAAGLRLLTETVVSPTLGGQIQRLLKDFPSAKWHQYEPVHRDMLFRGSRLAFGRPAVPRYDFTQADVVLSLDADFLIATSRELTLHGRLHEQAACTHDRARCSRRPYESAVCGGDCGQ